MADADSEIVALLREIRDLQQAHFTTYREFTTEVREQQKAAAERQQAAQMKSRDQMDEFRSQIADQRERTHAALANIGTMRAVSIAVGVLQTIVLAGLVLLLLSRLT